MGRVCQRHTSRSHRARDHPRHPTVASQKGAAMMRSAIVTGAGTGIGRATALRLARDGHAVVLAGRRLDPLQAVAREITAAGGRALAVAGDVARSQQAETLVAQTIEAFGRIDVLVNNAGSAT